MTFRLSVDKFMHRLVKLICPLRYMLGDFLEKKVVLSLMPVVVLVSFVVLYFSINNGSVVKAVKNDDLFTYKLLEKAEKIKRSLQMKDSEEYFLLALESDSPDILNYMVSESFSVDFNIEGKSLLMSALEKQLDINALLQRGADVNFQDNEGIPVLYYAFENSSPSVVVSLIEAGADLSVETEKEGSALLSALAAGQDISVIKALVEGGVLVSEREINYICLTDDVEKAKYLLESWDWSISSQERHPLIQVISKGNKSSDMVLLVLDSMNKSSQEVYHEALYRYVHNSHFKPVITERLISSLDGVEGISRINQIFNTALLRENFYLAELLLDKGLNIQNLDLNISGNRSSQLLHKILSFGYVFQAEDEWHVNTREEVDLLLQNGMSLDYISPANSDDIHILNYLFSQGQDLEKKADYYFSLALNSKSEKMLHYLLSQGVDPNKKITQWDENRNSYISSYPIFSSGAWRSSENLKLLAAYGADLYKKELFEQEIGEVSVLYNAVADYDPKGIQFLVHNGAELPLDDDLSKKHLNWLYGSEVGEARALAEVNYYYEAAAGKLLFKDLQDLLFYCIENDRNSEVEELLKIKGEVSLNKTDSRGKTPLVLAVEKNNKYLFDLFLKKGADVNFSGGVTERAIETAFFHGNREMVDALLEKGADVHFLDDIGNSLLHKMVEKRSYAGVYYALKAGVDKDLKNSEESTASDLAEMNSMDTILALLKNYGLTYKGTEEEAEKELREAVERKRPADVAALLAQGVELQYKSWDYDSHFLFEEAEWFLQKQFIIHGFDVNQKTPRGRHLYWNYGGLNTFEQYRLKIVHGLDINNSAVPARYTGTEMSVFLHYINNALSYAPFSGESDESHIDAIKFMMRAGADIYAVDQNTGDNAYSLAIKRFYMGVAEFLLIKGVNPNVYFYNKEIDDYITPLMYAAIYGNDELFEFVLKNGALVNLRSRNKGYSAMDLALKYRHYNVVEQLGFVLGHDGRQDHSDEINRLIKAYGVPEKVYNGHGNYIFNYAIRNKKYDLLELLLKNRGTRLHRPDVSNYILRTAVTAQDMRALKLMLENGVNPNFSGNVYHERGSEKYPALYEAVRGNNAEAVELLLQYGANPSLKGGIQEHDRLLSAYELALRDHKQSLVELMDQYKASVGSE